MTDILLWIITNKLSLIFAGVGGPLAIGAAAIGIFAASPLINLALKIVGPLLLALAIFIVGFRVADERCDARALNARIVGLERQIKVRDAELQIANAIQQSDAERARRAEEQLRQNQEAIDATPANASACLDRDAARRLRRVK